jgi:hypothetical protein
MSDAPRWEETLTRRVRSLARTGPLHRIEAGKSARARDLSRHDLRALALRAIDATIEHMGLGYGATRRDVAEALSPLIRATEPETTAADLHEISELVVEHLLNEINRRLQFDEPYVGFDGTAATTRSVRFHLLKEEEADDGSIVLKATTEAINLYAGMLDVDVEDAQTAAEAVLKAQIERGAIGSAVATARQARLRSIEYAESLRSTLRQVRRDVSRVDPHAMLRTVSAARKHLEQRLQVERGLLDAVDERVVTAEVDDAPALVELKDALVDCRNRHLTLHHDLLGVNETWLAEQERQRFRRARASALPDLERDVFRPLVAETLGAVEPLIDPLLLAFHAPAPPRTLDLAGLVDALLAPRRREAEPELDHLEDDLEPIAAMEARFDPATVARVTELLAQGGTLAALLRTSREAGDSPAVRRLLVMRALWAWDPDPDEVLRATTAGRLADLEYVGQDLTLGGP